MGNKIGPRARSVNHVRIAAAFGFGMPGRGGERIFRCKETARKFLCDLLCFSVEKSISVCEYKSSIAGMRPALIGLVRDRARLTIHKQPLKMRLRSFGLAVITSAITALAISGCANDANAPMAPTAPVGDASRSLLGVLARPTTVYPLQRSTPLANNVSASTIVGVLGGNVSIPAAGLNVVIPPLAVAPGTRITVTALAGANVAYEFEPHGIKFAVPLVATQSLRGTQAQSGGLINPSSLFVGYFPDATNQTLVSELLNLNVNVLNETSVLTIWHFSGYIIATGRAQPGDE